MLIETVFGRITIIGWDSRILSYRDNLSRKFLILSNIASCKWTQRLSTIDLIFIFFHKLCFRSIRKKIMFEYQAKVFRYNMYICVILKYIIMEKSFKYLQQDILFLQFEKLHFISIWTRQFFTRLVHSYWNGVTTCDEIIKPKLWLCILQKISYYLCSR